MKIESVSFGNLAQSPRTATVDTAERHRKEPEVFNESSRDENKISPEELLDKIKALTENGLYSVRFENNQEANALIIKLVDRQSGELIRQIPSEELLGTSKFLRDFRGSVINTES